MPGKEIFEIMFLRDFEKKYGQPQIGDLKTENSRKKFIKDISEKNDSKQRLGGTIGAALFALMQGVQILRVHDVNEVIQSIKIFKELLKN